MNDERTERGPSRGELVDQYRITRLVGEGGVQGLGGAGGLAGLVRLRDQAEQPPGAVRSKTADPLRARAEKPRPAFSFLARRLVVEKRIFGRRDFC